MPLSANLVGSTTSMANTINSSQPQPTQYSSEAQYNETTPQCPAVSMAYSVEISEEGASLNSQSSLTSESATLKYASESVNAAQLPSKPQQAGISSRDTGLSPAYSVEISEAGRQLSAGKSVTVSDTKSVASESTDDNDGNSASSTKSLSQYSDSQLQQMLTDGEISQSEYNTEMAKRKTTEEAETTDISRITQ